MSKLSISRKSQFVVDQNIAILTLKTGLLTVFFTEKRFSSINIGCINSNISNIIHIRVCSTVELRCLTGKLAIR